ncbi:MAG: translesion DNA synthesis-associated protein ImuA [Pseudomonadota bacterium]
MSLPLRRSVADAVDSSVGVCRSAARVPPAARAQQLADPSCLHPALWRAQAGGSGGLAGREATCPSGFGLLDAELPGGGWPVRVLTELLMVQPGVGEIRLLAPLMAELARQGRSVMLFNPPATLNAAALVELGCPPGACLVVQASPPVALPKRRPGRATGTAAEAELCWAVEQALRSGQLGALLAWPGRSLRAEALRRLQLSAQAHTGPAFLLREAAAARQPSPAPLRLALQAAGPDELSLRLFKRRGPGLAHPLKLALAPVLSDRARARALALQLAPVATAAGSTPDRPDPPPGEVGLQRPRSPVRPAGPAGSAAGGMASTRAQNAAAPL